MPRSDAGAGPVFGDRDAIARVAFERLRHRYRAEIAEVERHEPPTCNYCPRPGARMALVRMHEAHTLVSGYYRCAAGHEQEVEL